MADPKTAPPGDVTQRVGRCLTCAGRIPRGDFDPSAAASYFARPLSDLTIRTHEQWDMRRHRREHGLPAPNA